MKLGELFIELGITGDIKPLKQALSGMNAATIKAKLLTKYLKDLKKASTEEEKATVKRNFAQKINTLRTTENIKAGLGLISQAVKIATAITGVVVVFDRLGNSLLKTNQLFINFSKQTGLSIDRLNKLAGVAKLSGMGLSAEQVANDLTSLEQKIFNLGLTGQGSGIFAQLGMNPMGMKSDQFINALRHRIRGLSEVQQTYIVDQLGLSREWLNVLTLTDAEYADLQKQAKDLQLTEEERKELAKYTLLQQKNNMRWELAKQRLLKAIMPLVIKIMDATSKIALNISNALGNQKTLNIVKDIAGLFGVIAFHALRVNGLLAPLIKGLLKILAAGTIGSLFGSGAGLVAGAGMAAGGKGFLGKLLGFFGTKQAKKILAKQGAKMATTAAVGAATSETGIGAIIAVILEVIFGISLIYDLFKAFVQDDKDKEKEENTPSPFDTEAWKYSYNNMNSNMVNNFYNNPVPQQEIIDHLNTMTNHYLAGTKR